jgi:hypothetical protein
MYANACEPARLARRKSAAGKGVRVRSLAKRAQALTRGLAGRQVSPNRGSDGPGQPGVSAQQLPYGCMVSPRVSTALGLCKRKIEFV